MKHSVLLLIVSLLCSVVSVATGRVIPRWGGSLVGTHLNSDPAFLNAELTEREVVELDTSGIFPWPGSGAIIVLGPVVEFRIPVFEVLKVLGRSSGNNEVIDTLLPYLNQDVEFGALPVEFKRVVIGAMHSVAMSHRFSAVDHISNEPVRSFLRVTCSSRTSLVVVWALPDGRVFYTEMVSYV